MSDDYIPAATIVLLRDEPAFQVLMVERHADIAFAGGAMVFPGGRIERSDEDRAWSEFCDGEDGVPAAEIGPRIAAIREAFEESGILLARRDGELLGDEAKTFCNLRSQVEQDDQKFVELIRREGLSLALDELRLFARWRPPVEATHKRFDTWFFAAKAPPAQEASADGGEATSLIWTAPADVLADRDAGRRKMIFPTSRNVELVSVSDSADQVLRFAEKREIRPVIPEIVRRDGVPILTIPTDLGYPITEEPLATAFRI